MYTETLRLVRFAWQSMWRNLWLTIATASTIILTVLSLSFLLGIQVGIQQIISSTEKGIDLSVYFYPAVTESQVNSVVVALNTLPGVDNIIYVSKEQALANYEERVGDTPALLIPLEVIGENPFGAELIIRATSIESYGDIIAELQKTQYQELIEGQKKRFEENQLFIETFSDFANKVRFTAMAVSALFALIAALMVFNAVRVAIYTHRQEIAVMRLVGATGSFVKGPFVVELLFYATISVVLGGVIFFTGLYFLQPYLDIYFEVGEINLLRYFKANVLLIFGGQLLLILILGFVSTSLALRRYLKV